MTGSEFVGLADCLSICLSVFESGNADYVCLPSVFLRPYHVLLCKHFNPLSISGKYRLQLFLTNYLQKTHSDVHYKQRKPSKTSRKRGEKMEKHMTKANFLAGKMSRKRGHDGNKLKRNSKTQVISQTNRKLVLTY